MAAGGSGALALESLIHLFAAGYSELDEVFISIVDPDETNQNVERVIELIGVYKNIRSSMGNNPSTFFRTKIHFEPEYYWNPNSDQAKTLDDGILYAQLDKEGNMDYKLLTDLLFTDNQRTEPLDKGYKGNPMIGTIFMKDIERSAFFNMMRDEPEVYFFVFGSIFGGTGAAGLPVMANTLKKLRKDKKTIAGACITLPYFSLKQPVGEKDEKLKKENVTIRPDSSNFLPAVKFAIPFYVDRINNKRENGYNALYFVGSSESYKTDLKDFAIGGREQNNRSHFVNLYGASAYIDFLNNIQNYQTNSDTQYFASSVNYNDSLNYDNLPSVLKEPESKRLERFYITTIFFLKYFLKDARNELKSLTWFIDKKLGLGMDSSFYNERFITDFERYSKMFLRYLGQLYYNKVPLKLFKVPFYDENNDAVRETYDSDDIGDYYEHASMNFGFFKGKKSDLKSLNKHLVDVKYNVRGDKSSRVTDFLNWLDLGSDIYIEDYCKKHIRK
jgi:hypothetical protein